MYNIFLVRFRGADQMYNYDYCKWRRRLPMIWTVLILFYARPPAT